MISTSSRSACASSEMSAPPIVQLSRKGEERLREGHLWVFGDDLREIPPALAPGQWVRVVSRSGEPLGTGMLNLESRIALRIVSRGEASPGKAFLRERLTQAWRRREEAGLAALRALRLVYSEGDFLPGLIADRFGSILCIQILTAGMEALRGEIVESLAEMFPCRMIYERSEGGARRHEGLPDRKGPLHGGGEPREEVEMDGLRFQVDVEAGPKTGFFLDQRENRRIVRGLSAGKRVLDGFCSTGAFGFYALSGGAESVLAIDSSASAVSAAGENAARNGFADRWEGKAADLFSGLRELSASGRRFDMVVLDPPSFAKSREGREGALRGYKDINRLGLSVLAPEGVLATASCTQLVDMAKWKEALRAAAADAQADLQLLASGGQPLDHPVLLGMPETEYLKFAVYRKRLP
ncbi:MAG: class I SAM-dependent rRNA methyltransferase [Deltaproteobacteria bacterium]|nr:class I SAM-dependent rRNA methyltransferase [Deltaproteobacteria bacterium]